MSHRIGMTQRQANYPTVIQDFFNELEEDKQCSI
jgi:hypothetical protein